MHHAGFYDVAEKINKKFFSKTESFEGKDPNFKVICNFMTPFFPNWMQLHNKHIDQIDWKNNIKQFDIFVGGILGTDGIANHAVAIYNNWIFDANESIAILLCKLGLDYCVSTKKDTFEIIELTSGFSYREQGNKQRLKRRLEDKSNATTISNCNSFGEKQPNKKCFPARKVRKL